MSRLTLAVVIAAVAAAVSGPADAATPLPWCGTDLSSFDRTPDQNPGFSVHVVYAYPANAPDGFAAWAPRLVGDVAAIDAWWRAQDGARTPRFDLHSFGCDTAFGALDLSRVPLSGPIPDVRTAFSRIRTLLGNEHGLRQSEKVYLVYFDGPTGQIGRSRICGEADEGRRGVPAMALVYLDSCGSDEGDDVRVIVAVHELTHAFGGVDERAAPNGCENGHVCDSPSDLMTATLEDGPLESRVLDAGRDDYYGHGGAWHDVQESRFLERLDSPDRTPPSPPTLPTITNDRAGNVHFAWSSSTDDVGPLSYRVYRDGAFSEEVPGRSATFAALVGSTSVYSVRAVDGVGRLSEEVSLRFTVGLGIVDATGRLIRDTVPPGSVAPVAVRKLRSRVVLSWRAAPDRGGLAGYRIRVGSRLLATAKTALSLPRNAVTGAVRIVAVDRAGNAGPATTVPLRRLR